MPGWCLADTASTPPLPAAAPARPDWSICARRRLLHAAAQDDACCCQHGPGPLCCRGTVLGCCVFVCCLVPLFDLQPCPAKLSHPRSACTWLYAGADAAGKPPPGIPHPRGDEPLVRVSTAPCLPCRCPCHPRQACIRVSQKPKKTIALQPQHDPQGLLLLGHPPQDLPQGVDGSTVSRPCLV